MHQLVATAWHGPSPTSDHEIDHLDGDTTNNHPTNLEWVTRQQNVDRYWARRRGEYDGRPPWEVELERMDREPEDVAAEAALPF